MAYLNTYVKFFALVALFAVLCGGTLPARADNLNNEPWNFQSTNRASIAALMNQVESNGSNSGVTADAIGGSVTNLVCGNGANSSTATGNSACIILNNSTGDIATGQDTAGDQTADNAQTSTTNVTETINGPPPPEGLGDVLDDLN